MRDWVASGWESSDYTSHVHTKETEFVDCRGMNISPTENTKRRALTIVKAMGSQITNDSDLNANFNHLRFICHQMRDHFLHKLNKIVDHLPYTSRWMTYDTRWITCTKDVILNIHFTTKKCQILTCRGTRQIHIVLNVHNLLFMHAKRNERRPFLLHEPGNPSLIGLFYPYSPLIC